MPFGLHLRRPTSPPSDLRVLTPESRTNPITLPATKRRDIARRCCSPWYCGQFRAAYCSNRGSDKYHDHVNRYATQAPQQTFLTCVSGDNVCRVHTVSSQLSPCIGSRGGCCCRTAKNSGVTAANRQTSSYRWPPQRRYRRRSRPAAADSQQITIEADGGVRAEVEVRPQTGSCRCAAADAPDAKPAYEQVQAENSLVASGRT